MAYHYTATIIIPTLFAKPELLVQCLASVLQLELYPVEVSTGTDVAAVFRPLTVEVLVMANVTESELTEKQLQVSTQLLSMTHPHIELKWHAMGKNTGFVGAVNKGISLAHGEFICFLNDDAEVDSQWLRQLLITQKQTGAGMVASLIYLSDRQTLDSAGFGFAWRGKAEALRLSPHLAQDHASGLMISPTGATVQTQDTYSLDTTPVCSLSTAPDYWLQHPDLLAEQTNLAEPFGPDGAAALFTRDLFDQVGWLSADFFAYLEDVELALRARQQGFTCALAREAHAYHHKHATSSGFSRFKARQDLVNWVKIVWKRYPLKAWIRFGRQVMIERLRNVNGWLKSS